MSRMFDPYEVLGVPRGAAAVRLLDGVDVRAKATHPDAGGDAASFAEVSRAISVLSDPARRRRFDETGQADEARMGEVDAAATQIIVALVDQVVQESFGSSVDPERIDLVGGLRAVLAETLSGYEFDLGGQP
jgi:curved DNA-binding protein CbpA